MMQKCDHPSNQHPMLEQNGGQIAVSQTHFFLKHPKR